MMFADNSTSTSSKKDLLSAPDRVKDWERALHVENYSVVTKEKLQYFEGKIRPAYVS